MLLLVVVVVGHDPMATTIVLRHKVFYEPFYEQDKQYEDVRRFAGQDLARFSTLSHMVSR